MNKSVAIVGAGIVGICTAIELLKSGHKVTLFDKNTPGEEASRWNAGVLATSSFIPLNNPTLIGNLPLLLLGRKSGFRINHGQLFHTLPWAVRFCYNARTRQSNKVAMALHSLIEFSHKLHKEHLQDCAQSKLLTENGWLFVFRSKASFAASSFQRNMLEQHDVAYQDINADMLKDMEPALSGKLHSARLLNDSASAEPAKLLDAYIAYVHRLGGKFQRTQITQVSTVNSGISLFSEDKNIGVFTNVVIAAGAWTNQILRSVDLKLPMVVERGYLKTFALKNSAKLNRPIFDVEAGCVVSPRQNGVQISTGTELTTVEALPNETQLHDAIEQVKSILPLGDALLPTRVFANRPSLVDSLPAIGPIKTIPGLWLATGHQHIGFSTSAATGRLIGAHINRSKYEIDPKPYLPERFGI